MEIQRNNRSSKTSKTILYIYGIFLITAVGSGVALFIFHRQIYSRFFKRGISGFCHVCRNVFFTRFQFAVLHLRYKTKKWDILNQETVRIKNEWEQWACAISP